MAKSMNITYEEAKSINDKETAEVLSKNKFSSFLSIIMPRSITDRVYYARTSAKYKLNSDISAEIGAKFKVLDSAGHKEILRTDLSFTKKGSGASIVNWEELDKAVYPRGGSYPTSFVEVTAVGHFYFEIDNGVDVGFDLGGFSIGGSTSSTTTYTSDAIDLTLDVNASSL